jgi:hypothetical protein
VAHSCGSVMKPWSSAGCLEIRAPAELSIGFCFVELNIVKRIEGGELLKQQIMAVIGYR